MGENKELIQLIQDGFNRIGERLSKIEAKQNENSERLRVIDTQQKEDRERQSATAQEIANLLDRIFNIVEETQASQQEDVLGILKRIEGDRIYYRAMEERMDRIEADLQRMKEGPQ